MQYNRVRETTPAFQKRKKVCAMPTQASYIDRDAPDSSGITLLREQADADSVPGPASRPPLHRHRFYELVLVLRGSCEFFSGQGRLSLIPGDLLLLSPGRPHAYYLQRGAQTCCCQFETGIFSGVLAASLQDMVYWNTPEGDAAEKRVRALRAFETEARAAGRQVLLHMSAASMQGMLHLSHAETDTLFPLLQGIGDEQAEQHFGFEQMKLLLLQQVLLLVRRMQLSQFERVSRASSWKEEMIGAVLTQIDRDIAQDIDFEAIAHEQGITLTYFRTLFKEVTGMPPTDYLNRVRILHALELLQTSDAPVAEIGRAVGIYDANYFSRLFKKITGYPPRYFKAIPPESGQ